MKARLVWFDLRVIRDVISVLATQGWQKSLDEEDCESDNEDTEKMDPWSQYRGWEYDLKFH